MSIEAKIGSIDVSFPPSVSSDVAGYRMYYCPESEELTEDSPFIDLGNTTNFQLPGDFEDIKYLDGEYRVAGRSYDDEGNFGPSGPEVIVPLDFQPPEAPGAFEFSSVE